MADFSDVSYIIVNYYSAEHTLASIESIVQNTHQVSYEILLVDNNSGFDRETVSHWPQVRLLLSDRNRGYGAGCDWAARQAHSRYLFFINNDTRLLNDAGGELARFLDTHLSAALAGPQLIDSRLRPAISFDYEPTLALKLFGKGLLKALTSRHFPPRDGSVQTPTLVDLTSGACMFIRTEIYRAIGGFDPQFFLYCEEEDLALRVRRKGYEVYFVPSARVLHIGGGSSKNIAALKKEFYISFFKFYSKHYGPAKTAAVKALCFQQFLLRLIFRNETALWTSLIRWFIRGAPSSESLRYAVGNSDGPLALATVPAPARPT